MYERLDKIRGELDRAKQRRAEAEAKVKALEEKLREAENTQVLADVNALKLTPEQVAQFLQLAASGQLPLSGSAARVTEASFTKSSRGYSDNPSNEEMDNLEDDMEDINDEDN